MVAWYHRRLHFLALAFVLEVLVDAVVALVGSLEVLFLLVGGIMRKNHGASC
jgi:hypothetical protein